MRRRTATSLAFALALFTPDLPRASAQAKPIEETILTADGVKLRGLFHRSPKAGPTDPVVLLLYPPGVGRDMTKGDWPGLIQLLLDEKFHVFQFDWRGHGKSTDIADPAGNPQDPFTGFWVNRVTGPYNQRHIPGANKKPLKNTLFVKELGPAYFPVYVEDLAAVRTHLDQKNDQGDLNSSSIYVIGADEAATLGLLWMTAEWLRPAIHPNLPNGGMYKSVPTAGIQNNPEGGRDIAGAVWLSGSRPVNVPAIGPPHFPGWVKMAPPLRDNNPMLFLYGQKDAAGKTAARYLFDEALVADGDPQRGLAKLLDTHVREVPGTNLRGVGLLGMNANLKTEDTVLAYLTQMRKNRGTMNVKKRNFAAPYHINLPSFGVTP